MSLLRQIASKLKRLAHRVSSHPNATNGVDFQCNVCGANNHNIERARVSSREENSCLTCHSSLRMRSVIHALSKELFGKPLILPDFPEDKDLLGLGMSDWDGYALALANKLGYTNTYYHTEPRLDIIHPDANWLGKTKFLISGDVFEHIPIRDLGTALRNCRRLLSDGGFMLFTVPYFKIERTREHFPNLYDYRIEEENGKRVLLNTTIDGHEERFENLVFHGGEGSTLEMREFAEADLLAALKEAGFSDTRIYTDIVPEHGILWPMDWAVPIAARA